MKKEIYPCIWFDGKAQEAAGFYTSVFAASKINADNGMVIDFEICGKRVIGLNGGPMFKVTPAISFFIKSSDKNKMQVIWDALIAKGSALMPLAAYPWSAYYGWVQDEYGVSWQLMLEPTIQGEEQLIPSFLFTKEVFGMAEEAIEFYSNIFEGSSKGLVVHYPEGDDSVGKLMYGDYTIGVNQFIAMDGPGSHNYSFNEGLSLVVNCDDQKEIDYYWNALLSGGGIESMCGWLKDKFGVSWQVIPTILPQLMSDPVKGQKVIEAFMKMKKFDLEALIRL